MNNCCDVAIIGAGPAGACAASLLAQQGVDVQVFEREQFPRFSIGESLLPQCMTFLEQAGLLDAVNQHGFQRKDGAVFLQQGQFSHFEFDEKFSPGPSQTFQVQRDTFDKILADGAEKNGAKIHYRHQLEALCNNSKSSNPDYTTLTIKDLTTDTTKTVNARFVLDASGFGRVLPRLLDLESPSDFPVRQAVFTHITDQLPDSFDRNKILIIVHPQCADIWLWLIPFSNGTSSLGVVARQEQFAEVEHLNHEQQLMHFVDEIPQLKDLLSNASVCAQVRCITGYSANVSTLYGERFALLGNAGEFLDPVFSSGVTIAMQSAIMAAPLVVKTLNGETVDWENEFSQPLRRGISTFKTFVEGWYNGDLRNVIFYPNPDTKIKRMVCSVLAGYAWDSDNPLVKHSKRRLKALAESCAQ